MGNNDFKDPFMPLIPGNHVINFNDIKEFEKINESIACVIIEPVQGEAGIIPADKEFLKGLRKKCNETGTLLIFDEVQTGFGRTGSMFAFEDYEVVPDIITLAKAMGGGMPIGAFISSKEIMSTLSKNPELGHITTFGGHPVSCAASLASLQVLIKENLVKQVKDKEFAFIERLKRIPYVKKYRSKGLMIAIEFESFDITREIVKTGLENGILVDWFLFAPQCIRLAPPLTISFKLIEEAMDKFETTLNQNFN
jgi:acetylornithine/succinyldiaminopimelate/putrescine aminotransferase